MKKKEEIWKWRHPNSLSTWLIACLMVCKFLMTFHLYVHKCMACTTTKQKSPSQDVAHILLDHHMGMCMHARYRHVERRLINNWWIIRGMHHVDVGAKCPSGIHITDPIWRVPLMTRWSQAPPLETVLGLIVHYEGP